MKEMTIPGSSAHGNQDSFKDHVPHLQFNKRKERKRKTNRQLKCRLKKQSVDTSKCLH